MSLISGLIKKSLLKTKGLHRLKSTSTFYSKDFLLFIIPLVLICIVLFWPRENIFTVNAETDTLVLKFSDNLLNQWDVSSAIMILDPFDGQAVQLDAVDSFIHISSDVRAQITMLNKRVHITLEGENSIGQIDTPTLTKALGNYAEFTISVADRKEKLFPFYAAMILGDDMAVGVDKILRKANVTIVEQQLFQNDRYSAGEYSLEMGDKLMFYNDNGVQAAGKGFLSISEKKHIELVSHTVAKRARVERLGSGGYDIKASVWARVIHDPIISAITTLIATIFLTLEFFIIMRKLLTGKI
jgi:hypothetical protein